MGGFLFFGFVMRAVVLVLFLAALAYAQQGRGSDYTLSFFGSENCNIETLIVQQVFDLSECTNFRYNNLHDGYGQSLQCLFVDVDDEDYSDNLECPRQFSVTPRTIIPDYGVVVEYNPTGCSSTTPSETRELLFGQCIPSPNYAGCFMRLHLGGPESYAFETGSPASVLAVPVLLFLLFWLSSCKQLNNKILICCK